MKRFHDEDHSHCEWTLRDPEALFYVVWDHSPLTAEGERKLIPTAAGPKVTSASVKRETESESSLRTLMERLNNQAITVCCRDITSILVFLHPMLFPETAGRGGLNIRDTGQCPELSCFFPSYLELKFLCINFLHWYIACRRNGNNASLWDLYSL